MRKKKGHSIFNVSGPKVARTLDKKRGLKDKSTLKLVREFYLSIRVEETEGVTDPTYKTHFTIRSLELLSLKERLNRSVVFNFVPRQVPVREPPLSHQNKDLLVCFCIIQLEKKIKKKVYNCR